MILSSTNRQHKLTYRCCAVLCMILSSSISRGLARTANYCKKKGKKTKTENKHDVRWAHGEPLSRSQTRTRVESQVTTETIPQPTKKKANTVHLPFHHRANRACCFPVSLKVETAMTNTSQDSPHTSFVQPPKFSPSPNFEELSAWRFIWENSTSGPWSPQVYRDPGTAWSHGRVWNNWI